MTDFLFILPQPQAVCGRAAHIELRSGSLAVGSDALAADCTPSSRRSLRLSRGGEGLTSRPLHRLAARGSSLREQLTAVKQQPLDIRLRPSDALLISSLLPGLATQFLQLLLQGCEPLLHRHQSMREGMQRFRQILGMAADPK